MHRLACAPTASMGADIDRDLAEFAAKMTRKYADWDSTRDPYDRKGSTEHFIYRFAILFGLADDPEKNWLSYG